MVNDFLDWQTISQQTFSLQPKRITLNTLLQEVVDLNHGLEERYSTKLVTQFPTHPVRVVVDPLRITQVLTNLISNAAKFSPNDSPVTISLTSDALRATVSIQDHGEGIPEDLQDTVFERFKQGEQRTSNPNMKGTGLGLAICKSIIDLHEGELWFETSPKGTTFFFAINLPTQTTHHGFS